MYFANAISYITDEEKMQKGSLMGSYNCNADTALQEKLSSKRKYGKTDKRQGCHFIISFKEQEVIIKIQKNIRRAWQWGLVQSSLCIPSLPLAADAEGEYVNYVKDSSLGKIPAWKIKKYHFDDFIRILTNGTVVYSYLQKKLCD